MEVKAKRKAESRGEEAVDSAWRAGSPEIRGVSSSVGEGGGREEEGRPQPRYLGKAVLHMPTHLLLRSCQGAAAQGTYLPFILLPPFHFPNPSCMEKQKIKHKIS